MTSDDHSIVPIPDSELDRRGKGNNPILQRMAKDILTQSKDEVTQPKDELADDSHVHFKCPNLEKAIREEWEKPEGPLTRSDMASLECLERLAEDVEEFEITDLSGLEHATKLESLWLEENQITEVSPLAGLTKLWRLCLAGNRIIGPTPLAGFTNLKTLVLGENPIPVDHKQMLRKALPKCKIVF